MGLGVGGERCLSDGVRLWWGLGVVRVVGVGSSCDAMPFALEMGMGGTRNGVMRGSLFAFCAARMVWRRRSTKFMNAPAPWIRGMLCRPSWTFVALANGMWNARARYDSCRGHCYSGRGEWLSVSHNETRHGTCKYTCAYSPMKASNACVLTH